MTLIYSMFGYNPYITYYDYVINQRDNTAKIYIITSPEDTLQLIVNFILFTLQS